MSRFSTNTNSLECTFDWFVATAHSDSVDVIYIDFSKAFDSIVYSKLLFKLSSLGITGKLLAWLAAFLHNRNQCVAIENIFSSVSSVISGVPQGSVLGPVLFLVFINDIDVICHGRSRIKLFADDLKIYNIVDITNPTATLQLSLDHLVKWSAEWQLPINIKKCSVLTINGSESHKTLTASDYYLEGLLLAKSTSVMDLGVEINSDLSFQSHIGSIVSKARQRVGVLFRGFHTRQVSFLKKAYITYIRPLLEYNSNIWNPTHVYLIDLMENVQRAFTKHVKAISKLPYIERLGIFNLEPLELRRLRYDLVQYYKILNNLTPLNPADYFELHYPPTSARDPSPIIVKPICYTNKVLSGCFFYRHIDCWNSLPSVVRNIKTLPAFKSALCSIDLSDFLRGSAFRF
jgi:ribonuclease P/MRP protein subunit RPP40